MAASQDACEVVYQTVHQKVVPDVAAAFAGHKNIKYTKIANIGELKTDKAIEAKHPSLTLPFLKTSDGDVISTETGVMGYIARSNPGANLFGKSVFEEGRVNQWIAWAECLVPYMTTLTDMIFNVPKEADLDTFNRELKYV